MQKQLGQLLLVQLLVIHEIQQDDYAHLLTLMEKYRDRPMDLADATLVLAAEKTGCRQILTLDSDFLFYRIGDRERFDVIQVQWWNAWTKTAYNNPVGADWREILVELRRFFTAAQPERYAETEKSI